jgi:hypothetical protein
MPIPWDTIKYYDNINIALYNSKIKEICDKNNLQFIDMLDLLKNEDLEDCTPTPQDIKKCLRE